MSLAVLDPVPLPTPPRATAAPGCVVIENVAWSTYEAMLAAFGDDHPSLRLTYREGTLQIMTTSRRHEIIKKLLARLFELWALETERRIVPCGAATFREKAKARGLEPDECYWVGEMTAFPDVAIEVVETHGLVDELDVYAGLGVREVWVFEEGRLSVHVHAGDHYDPSPRSRLLPSLDLAELVSFVDEKNPGEAVFAYRAALRAASRSEAR